MSIKAQLLQKKNWWHVGAIVLFLAITIGYFSPAFDGYTINQGDVTNWSGAAQEIKDYRDNGNETVHWTNSMFSGMPGVQISGASPGMVILDEMKLVLSLWLPSPANHLFLYFIGFYVLGLTLRIKPSISALGAIAYGLSSYFIIILQAGHNTKAAAIGYAPLVLASFLWSYRSKKMILPLALAALFMAFELRANHLQITYYLGMVLVAVGIFELVKAVKEKALPNFSKRTVGLLAVYGLAIGLNYANIKGTLDYAQFTTRGGSELTINADGSKKEESKKQSGLDTEYITAWSYGIGETFSLIVPNFKGGATGAIGSDDNKDIVKNIDRQYKQNIVGMNQYWGEQPFTSGPVYIGVIVVFLAFLALFYVDDKLKWGLLAITIFTIMLSWGKNYLGFTEFFLDYLPGYNKFRAVTIILFVAELTLPLLAILFLNKLIKKREEIAQNLVPFFVVTGFFIVLFIMFMIMPTAFNDFLTSAELGQLDTIPAGQEMLYEGLFEELERVRIEIFSADVMRSLIYLILGAAAIFFAIKNKDFAKMALVPVLALFIIFDLLSIDFRYLGKGTKDKQGRQAEWKQVWKQKFPVAAAAGDKQILELELVDPVIKKDVEEKVALLRKDLKSEKIKGGELSRRIEQKQFRTLGRHTNFRVYEQGNPFNSSRTSYFHKSIGGYHGAKLGSYQELIEFHLSQGNQSVLNMLNMKYSLAPGGQQAIPNPKALGNVWFVKTIEEVTSADEEILALSVNNRYNYELFNGYKIVLNGSLDSVLSVIGNEQLSITTPLGESLPLVDVPYQASVQQTLGLFNTAEGLQWGYFNGFNPQLIATVSNIQSGFTPGTKAIMQTKFSDKLSAREFNGQGQIVMTSYHPDHISYSSNSTENQLAIFSEMYIAQGWAVYIDDNKVDLLKANYVLRAVEIPAGDHKIEMKYDVPSFKSGNRMSLWLTIVIILIFAVGFYIEVFKAEKSEGIE
jgi:hypothetical protein